MMEARIRLATVDDAESIRAIYAPIVTGTTISFELEPPTPQEMAERIAKILSGQRPWLVYEARRHVIAFAYASAYRERAAYAWSVESSIVVDGRKRGTGIGSRLYARLMAILAAQGFRSVFAAIAQPNEASNALHAKLGFSAVGSMQMAGFKHGAWRDVQWWQKQLDRSTAPPAATLSLESVMDVISAS